MAWKEVETYEMRVGGKPGRVTRGNDLRHRLNSPWLGRRQYRSVTVDNSYDPTGTT